MGVSPYQGLWRTPTADTRESTTLAERCRGAGHPGQAIDLQEVWTSCSGRPALKRRTGGPATRTAVHLGADNQFVYLIRCVRRFTTPEKETHHAGCHEVAVWAARRAHG